MIVGKIYNLNNKNFTPIEFSVIGQKALHLLFVKILRHYNWRLKHLKVPKDSEGNIYDVVYGHKDYNDMPVIGISYIEDTTLPNLEAGAA